MFGPGPKGWWDSGRVSCPRVLRGADGQWKMWYYGRDPDFDRKVTLPTGRVGLATSDDGIRWQRVAGPLTMGAVFEPHPDLSRFDSSHVGITDIHFHDELYWMWYLGGDQSIRKFGLTEAKGFPMLPGCAISRDGLHWTRLAGPHRGALLDVGVAGDFDEAMVSWPQVVRWDDGSWRLYYHGLNAQRDYTMGWAESLDGLSWQKRGPLLGPGPTGRFDDKGVATRHMLKIGGRWVLFYEGCRYVGSPVQVDRQIGVAVSDDGLDWRRVDGPLEHGAVLAQATKGSGGWDYRIGCPWVVPMPDGSLRLYYIGSNEHQGGTELETVHQIGVAVSDGDITQWRRYT
ncbi:MAG: glycosyl hydrolase [Proteobacteria bacterium]|nr:glycosyl hydrolase [Pseudomonadota bacterium]